MVDLTDVMIYTPAKNGNVVAAKKMVELFLEELRKSPDRFNPYVFEYAIRALENIVKGEKAEHAFLLKRKGGGNKKNHQNTETEIEIAQNVWDLIKEKGCLRTTAIKIVSENDSLRLGKTFDAIRKICDRWLPAFENHPEV